MAQFPPQLIKVHNPRHQSATHTYEICHPNIISGTGPTKDDPISPQELSIKRYTRKNKHWNM